MISMSEPGLVGLGIRKLEGTFNSEKQHLYIQLRRRNYGPTILPQMLAAEKKYSQVLWLFGEEHAMTEVGTMNLFVHWINENGEKELITAPLTRGDILPGVTRQSILELCREWGEFKVTEETVTLPRVRTALREGRVSGF